MNEQALLFSLALIAVSGLASLLLRRGSDAGQRTAFFIFSAGALFGMIAAGAALFSETNRTIDYSFFLKDYILIDHLSAFFLLPLFFVTFSGALYGLGYYRASENPDNGRMVSVFYGLLTAGMGLVVIANHALVFLTGWEIMALSAFFLIAANDESREVRRAGWIYFVATHCSTLLIFGFFAVYRTGTGTYSFMQLPAAVQNADFRNILFLTAFFGFGLKAGLYPLHVWLPPAHANAPTHVSSVLSGMLLKMGVYGMLRALWMLPEAPLWQGALLLCAGVVSGVVGVVHAIGQHDLKRLLAYHSIENIGIIFAGIGLATMGATMKSHAWIALGMGGALLHVWNHALFKSLLFQAAGSVIRAVGLRNVEFMGGLAKIMPLTALCFLVGAVAICGLPFLNGFVSELFIYLGLARMATFADPTIAFFALLAVAGLALMGALALACFVKVYGIVFLGNPRAKFEVAPQESPWPMKSSMILLSLGCLLIGLFPALAARALDPVLAFQSKPDFVPPLAGLAPINALTLLGPAGLVVMTALVFFSREFFGKKATRVETWGCGYAPVSPSMQYTASSFARAIVHSFKWLLFPVEKEIRLRGLFARSAEFESHVPDAVLDKIIYRFIKFTEDIFAKIRVIHSGSVQIYALYIFITLILLLLLRRP